jgi:hypothetical protein
MEALTQCWFTRVHQPERKRHREADGSVSSLCRHCHRPIISWNRLNWFLAGGFNLTRLAETAARFITVLDREDDYISPAIRWRICPMKRRSMRSSCSCANGHGMNEPAQFAGAGRQRAQERAARHRHPPSVSGAELDSPQSA